MPLPDLSKFYVVSCLFVGDTSPYTYIIGPDLQAAQTRYNFLNTDPSVNVSWVALLSFPLTTEQSVTH